jgi:cysteine-rich repeat protein
MKKNHIVKEYKINSRLNQLSFEMTRKCIYILVIIVSLSMLLIHSAKAQDMTPPAPPQGLTIIAVNMSDIEIAWDANTEPDLAGYILYHRTVGETSFSPIAPLPLSTSYTIIGLTPGINFLKITAFDNSGIESDFSNVVSDVAGFICGDSILSPEEECDDGNASPTDGCDSMCMVENGWVCEIPGAPCRQITCGDGLVEGEEECDDGNLEDGDGCSSACLVEEPPPTVTAIPTLSQWGLITMAGVLGIVGFMVIRRRKVTA